MRDAAKVVLIVVVLALLLRARKPQPSVTVGEITAVWGDEWP